MHDPFCVHVVQRRAELDKVLPDGSLGDQLLVALKVLDHAGEVASVGQLENDVQLVVLDEGGQVGDHVRVIQLLEFKQNLMMNHGFK